MEKISILLGKTVQKLTKLRGNGGSALPGLIVERLNPHFLQNILQKLPRGVVVISGTNGKTTTTKIVSELLADQGMRVFTNKSGSNFVRGVISEILANISLTGKFNYDIAVLELDEAHAVKFSEACSIDYALFLNVQRDQLDRFGEIDHTAALLQKVATKVRKLCVLNREDPRINQITAKNRSFFGLSASLLQDFPSDDNLLECKESQSSPQNAKVVLEKLNQNQATYLFENYKYTCSLTLKGIYNAYNAAGALALCTEILPTADFSSLIKKLTTIQSAFGRGEIFELNHCKIELFLVKNPAAFQLSLASFADTKHDYMIAINDNIADGHDVSWLWNINFSKLKQVQVCSGIRASDMALRLKYDEIPVDLIEPDLTTALQFFAKNSRKPKRIFATYTAMLELRKIISGKSIL